MRYKNLLLSMSVASILLMYGCGKQESEQGTSKESTSSQSEATEQSNKNVKTADNIQLTSSNDENKKLNYTIVTEKYQSANGRREVEYPQIKGLNNEIEEKINKQIKEKSNLSDGSTEANEGYTTGSSFEVKTQNESMVSICVYGWIWFDGAARPDNSVSTYNIDLSTGEFKRLVDTGRTEEFASRILNGEYKIIRWEGCDFEESEVRALIDEKCKGKTKEQIKQELDKFDMDIDVDEIDTIVKMLSGDSYYEDGKIVLCISTGIGHLYYNELVFD